MPDTLLALEQQRASLVHSIFRTWQHAHWFVHWYQWQCNQPLSAAE
jgi:hypothetical protein